MKKIIALGASLLFATGLVLSSAGCGGGGGGGIPNPGPGPGPGGVVPTPPAPTPGPAPGTTTPAPGPTPAPPSVPRGTARVLVDWNPSGTPASSQSVRITLLKDGTKLGESIVIRPTDGNRYSSATFTDISPATITVNAAAYPTTDGTGTAQASGTLSLVVEPGKTAEAILSLVSTIQTVRLSASALNLQTGKQGQLRATALDASGAIVLTAPDSWEWSSANSSVASVTASGDTATVTGGSSGTTTIRAREKRSGKTAQATITTSVYSSDFGTAVGPEWSSTATDITPVGQRKFLGQFGKETVRLTLSSLPVHRQVKISFDLFILRSWDGNLSSDPVKGGAIGPDRWKFSLAGGPTLLDTTFRNFASGTQSFPNNYLKENPSQSGAVEKQTLGYQFQDQGRDAVYHLSYTVPHTASSAVFEFDGAPNQPKDDESWGLTNVIVELVP